MRGKTSSSVMIISCFLINLFDFPVFTGVVATLKCPANAKPFSTFIFQDKKSVESTCLCFARLVDNFQHEEVCSSSCCFFLELDVSGMLISVLAPRPLPTEPSAGGRVPRPLDQHSAVAGRDSSCAQLGNVHYGCTHVFPHVLQLSLPGSPTYETK